MWEHFEHAADVGVRGRGETIEEAFAEAARALFALVAEDLENIRLERSEEIQIASPGLEELLVAFLNELIFLFDTRRVVFGKFDLKISQEGPSWRLGGKVFGEPYDPQRHAGTVDPKGATFTALKVAQENGEWTAQCVVDV